MLQQDQPRSLRIIHAIFTHNFWGSERAAVELANQQSLRHDVTLMVRDDCDRDPAMSIIDRAAESVRIVRIPSKFKSIHMIRQVLRLKPDIFHSHLGRAARLSGLVLPWVPRVATLHVWTPKHYRRQDALICISDWQLEALPPKMRSRARVIHNSVIPHDPIAPDRRLALRREIGLEDDDYVAGFVGRLNKAKGFDLALQAFRDADLPRSVLVVIGEGELKASITEMAGTEMAGTEMAGRRIIHLGFRPDVKDLYQLMDVLLVPSRFETFGLVLAEGMDAGCHVVASRINGLKQVLEGQKAGIFFEPEDAADLSRALTEAWTRRGERPAFDLSPFDISQRGADIERLYLDLLDGGRNSASGNNVSRALRPPVGENS